MKTLLSLIALTLVHTLMCQTIEISGTVMSMDNPVPFATLIAPDHNLSASSDSEGHFTLLIPHDTIKLMVSAIGFNESLIFLKPSTSPVIIKLTPRAEELNEVVISGNLKAVSKSASAVPVEVYSSDFLLTNPSSSIFESLQNINGVKPTLNCAVCATGDIRINGLEGPYTMVLIDGMPSVSGLATVYGLSGIPQSLIERVEIVKGPASTLYGSEAVAGLINVITKKPGLAPRFSADVRTSSWGEINADLGTKFNIGEKLTNLTGLNIFSYSNPIDNNGDSFTDLTLQKRFSVFNKLNIKRASQKAFTVSGRLFYEDRWGGSMNWTPENRGGNQIYGESIKTQRWEVFGEYEFNTTEDLKLQFSANHHTQDSYYGTMSYKADQSIFFNQLIWNKAISNTHSLTAGAALRRTTYDDNTTATLFESENAPALTWLPGIFIQDEIYIKPNLQLLTGLRADHHSAHGTILSPRANLKWNSKNKRTILRLSAGNGFRVANVFTEDHAALTGARDVVFLNELNPERSWNTNLNVVKSFLTKKDIFITLDASAFYTYFNNRIIPDYDTDPNLIIYDNLEGYSVSKGLTANVDIDLPSGLDITAGATLMDVSLVEDGIKTDQLFTEDFTAVWGISYTIERLNLTANYTGNLYSPMRLPLLGDLDPRDEYSPWYSIQNIKLSMPLSKRIEIYGGVKNLLNYLPPANSIARAFDPFDNGVQFNENGQVVPTASNPNGLSFDAAYVYASNQGINGYLGLIFNLD
ncbi:MAG: TonB-dependent receptor [Flavobacteriales bacterium]